MEGTIICKASFKVLIQWHSVECIWSSSEGIISVLVDKKIVAMEKIAHLAIFQDTRGREIKIAGTFEGKAGSGNIRNVQVFAEKEL